MSEILVSVRCYIKLVMHSLKYPHSTVNGLILAKKSKNSSGINCIEFVDCVPLFHSTHGLTPMLEMALIQVSNDSNFYINFLFTLKSDLIQGFNYLTNRFID
jgi:hypothetical protein